MAAWKRTAVGVGMAVAALGTAVGFAQSGKPVAAPGECPACPVACAKPAAAVVLEWAGPADVRINRPAEYTLTVKNVCGHAVQKVVVQVRPPQHAKLTAAAGAKETDGVWLWDLGTLDAGQSVPLPVTLTHTARGETRCQAWVTCTGTAAMRVEVKEPKLEVRIEAPKTVPLGEPIPVRAVISNTGNVAISGLEYTVLVPASDARKDNIVIGYFGQEPTLARDSSMGTLDPNKTVTKDLSDRWGVATGLVNYILEVKGADGMTATASTYVRIVAPKLAVTVAGPKDLLVHRKATYTVRVANVGDLAVNDVTVATPVPAGWRSEAVGTTRVAELAPGESSEFTFDATPTATGAATFTATATGSRGAKAAAAFTTTVDGVPALRMETIDLVDPVEKGRDTTYEVRVTNTGTKADANVVVSCPLPGQLRFVSATGPVGYTTTALPGLTVVKFDAVRELAPNTEAVFRVKVTAVAAGDVRFKAELNSRHLSTSVVKEESTRVYGE